MTDTRMDEIIGKLLRAGVGLAAAVVALGGAWFLFTAGGQRPDYGTFRPDVRGLFSLATLPAPEAVILVGLLLLVATPVARVVFSLFAFGLERDRMYQVFTLIVLIVLLYSLGTSWL